MMAVYSENHTEPDYKMQRYWLLQKSWYITVGPGFKALIKYHAMKTKGRLEVWLYVFLTWAVDVGKWSASRCVRYAPQERVASHWKGAWTNPKMMHIAIALIVKALSTSETSVSFY
jgi:hypothetical protein